ncbi:MAG: RNA-binding domain-containing protein [Minisyncoccota bacterium]
MDRRPRVYDRTPTPDELALGYAWGEDEGGELFQLKGVSQEDRRAHFYVVGATRTGKTKLLEEMIEQDIKNGEGFGVIDPHGDLVEAVKERLALAPENLDERVVLIDPTDKESSVCFNPLELPEGIKAAELAAELVLVFKKIWFDAWGARTDEIFRNTLIALIENDLTIAEFSLVLRDAEVRKRLLANVKNETCREFFIEQYGAWNAKTKTEWTAPILNKVGALLSDDRVREIFVSRESSFNLRRIMDEGKIILVKLDKGRLKGASELLGSLLLSKIQMAAFSRTDVRMSERRQFYLYIDEFQNFATESFRNTLDEAAKYKLSLVLAHQNLSQLPSELRASVLTNCGLQAYFRVARLDAELLAKEAFAGVYGEAPKWEDFFQELQTLPPRVCVVKNKIAGGVVFIRIPDITPAWEDAGMDEKEFEAVVKDARIGERYLRRRDEIEREYAERRGILGASDEMESFREDEASKVVSYEEMIQRGENERVEFKMSIRHGYENKGVIKPAEYIIAKGISSFMNADGGTLFVGVHDSGEILGIENDYATVKNKNRDGFLLQLTNIINHHLGKEFHQYTNATIRKLADKDICVIEVSRSKTPVFLRIAGKKEEFFIRSSASSQPMDPREMTEYIRTHFYA